MINIIQLVVFAVSAANPDTAALTLRAQKHDVAAILELGKAGNQKVVPILEKIASDPDSNKNFGGSGASAQMALARLGDKARMRTILDELQSEDPKVQSDATRKLAYVGGKDSVRALGQLLTQTAWRERKPKTATGKLPMDHVRYAPLADFAMNALAEIVPNPPTKKLRRPTKDEEKKWQDWWDKNKKDYE